MHIQWDPISDSPSCLTLNPIEQLQKRENTVAISYDSSFGTTLCVTKLRSNSGQIMTFRRDNLVHFAIVPDSEKWFITGEMHNSA